VRTDVEKGCDKLEYISSYFGTLGRERKNIPVDYFLGIYQAICIVFCRQEYTQSAHVCCFHVKTENKWILESSQKALNCFIIVQHIFMLDTLLSKVKIAYLQQAT
jgi:hypothetical protein